MATESGRVEVPGVGAIQWSQTRVWIIDRQGRKFVYSRKPDAASIAEAEQYLRDTPERERVIAEEAAWARAENERIAEEQKQLKQERREQQKAERLRPIPSFVHWAIPASDQLIDRWGDVECHLLLDPEMLTPEESDYLSHGLLYA